MTPAQEQRLDFLILSASEAREFPSRSITKRFSLKKDYRGTKSAALCTTNGRGRRSVTFPSVTVRSHWHCHTMNGDQLTTGQCCNLNFLFYLIQMTEPPFVVLRSCSVIINLFIQSLI